MKSARFTDFDAFAGAVGDVDASMMLRNATRRLWAVEKAELGRSHVQRGELGSGNLVEGRSWSDGYLIYLPLSDHCEYKANGVTIPDASFMILEPGSEFCLSTLHEHDWCSFFTPAAELLRLVTNATIESDNAGRCRVSAADPELARRFRTAVHEVMSASAYGASFEASQAAHHAQSEMLNIAAAVIAPGATVATPARGRPCASRSEVLRTCRQVLSENNETHPTVRELAAAAKVSERTLRRVFIEYTGMGPLCYMSRHQLHQVHRALATSDSGEVTLMDVVFRYGVWELGRFAARYRRLFGENPSDTLHRKQRHVVSWSSPVDSDPEGRP